jgi:hypothetical protein
MRRSLFGVGLGTLLVLMVAVNEGSSESPIAAAVSAPAPPTVSYQSVQPSSPPSGNLIAHVLPSEGGAQALVVVDPVQRVLAVYHVDKSTGEIGLRSVRNITWDLQLPEFNSGEPLPRDIRNMSGELKR